MGLSWMAWTWPTAAFFVFIALCITSMAVWEYHKPGGDPRRGVFALDTTRGDRLFISLLGSAFIFLAWLGLVSGPLAWPWAIIGNPMWWPVLISLCWGGFVFRYV